MYLPLLLFLLLPTAWWLCIQRVHGTTTRYARAWRPFFFAFLVFYTPEDFSLCQININTKLRSRFAIQMILTTLATYFLCLNKYDITKYIYKASSSLSSSSSHHQYCLWTWLFLIPYTLSKLNAYFFLPPIFMPIWKNTHTLTVTYTNKELKYVRIFVELENVMSWFQLKRKNINTIFVIKFSMKIVSTIGSTNVY